jgi:hypothetical protein
VVCTVLICNVSSRATFLPPKRAQAEPFMTGMVYGIDEAEMRRWVCTGGSLWAICGGEVLGTKQLHKWSQKLLSHQCKSSTSLLPGQKVAHGMNKAHEGALSTLAPGSGPFEGQGAATMPKDRPSPRPLAWCPSDKMAYTQ